MFFYILSNKQSMIALLRFPEPKDTDTLLSNPIKSFYQTIQLI